MLRTERGVEGYAYMGIPYAEAPVGPLRFRPPVPVKKWEGILQALDYGPSCIYNSTITTEVVHPPMSEDCLQVNVFSNERCVRHGNCSVMHYIFGGQFAFSSTQKFIPEMIVDNFNNATRDIVVVTFNYRLNVFGLLNLNHKMRDLLLPNIAIHGTGAGYPCCNNQ